MQLCRYSSHANLCYRTVFHVRSLSALLIYSLWDSKALTSFPPHSYASYLIWNDLGGCSSKAIIPLGLYGAQLAFNWAWPPFFFSARNLKMVKHPGVPAGCLGLVRGVSTKHYATVKRAAGRVFALI